MPPSTPAPTLAPPRASLKGKRVLVMGLGQFGGGTGVARFLVSHGADVLITDTKPAEKLQTSINELAGLAVRYRLGEHRIDDFTAADLVIVNPAVKPNGNPYLEAARAAGVALTSEIRLLTQHLPNRARTIGITGSAGKSTTTAMVGHVLRSEPSRPMQSEPSRPRARQADATSRTPRVHLGGNLGGSLLGSLDDIAPDDWVVLELSSFMLEGLREDQWSPHIALITNLSPNHLDWHGSLADYRRAKQAIFDFQTEDDIAILGPGADGFLPKRARLRTLHAIDLPELTAAIPDLLIPGEHNRLNAAMAIEACAACGFAPDLAARSLATFTGLPHRLELVAERNGIRYFNDSKCTTPEAAALALDSFATGIVHIILGGSDKGSNLAPLSALARRHCRAIYTIGHTGPTIAAAAGHACGLADVTPCETLDRAVAEIQSRVRPGDVVLLSPACASLDQFTHFEARGDAFTSLVQA